MIATRRWKWEHHVRTLAAYPGELWRLALADVAEPLPCPNHPPAGYDRRMRDKAMALLSEFGAAVEERQGIVYIGGVQVDGRYLG